MKIENRTMKKSKISEDCFGLCELFTNYRSLHFAQVRMRLGQKNKWIYFVYLSTFTNFAKRN